MDRASVFGTKGWRFESVRARPTTLTTMTAHHSLIWASEQRGPLQTGMVAEAVLAEARWHDAFASFAQRENGQDVVEYGILIATIAVVVLLGVTTFGREITPWFSQLAGHITTVGT